MKISNFLIATSLLITSTACAQKTINDANAERRSVGSFNAISVSSAIDLYVTVGGEDAVAVSATDKANVANIITEVKNGTLHIGYKDNKWMNWGNKGLKAYISARELSKIEASGACDILVQGVLKANDLELSLSGASDFKGQVNVQNLKLDASGSSDFNITGTANNAKIDLSGASDVNGYELTVDNCDVDASGSSDVKITVNKELKVDASGSSDVKYKGNGKTTSIRTSGSSDVKKM
jgi:hypothetical protein